MNTLTRASITEDTFDHQHDYKVVKSIVMIMFTLPSPLALLACAMLVGGGARDLMGAATSAADGGARFTKSFLSSVQSLDLLSCCMQKHSTAQHSTAEMKGKEVQTR